MITVDIERMTDGLQGAVAFEPGKPAVIGGAGDDDDLLSEALAKPRTVVDFGKQDPTISDGGTERQTDPLTREGFEQGLGHLPADAGWVVKWDTFHDQDGDA